MSYRPVTGVSPRFATCLELSDTLLCLGMTPVRARHDGFYRITFEFGHVDVHSPYLIRVRAKSNTIEKFNGPQVAKKYLIQRLA